MKGTMGMDIYCTLMLVFLVSTALLLRTADTAKRDSSFNDNSSVESRMKKTIDIDLPKDSYKGADRDSLKGTILLSARSINEKEEFYLNDQKVNLDEIAATINDMGSSAVEMRIDENIRHKTTNRLLIELMKANIKNVYFVYEEKS